jgi:L-alanine-DL-glutamate epimerase-like enolase superfamily enzyme
MFYGRKGLPVAVISVIDLALWDLQGKIRNEPVYNTSSQRGRWCHGGLLKHSSSERSIVLCICEMVYITDPRDTNDLFEKMYRASMFYGRKGLPVAVISVRLGTGAVEVQSGSSCTSD